MERSWFVPDLFVGFKRCDTLKIFVGVRYNFRAGFSMGAENCYIEKRSRNLASPEYICLDVTSSVISVVVVLLLKL